MAAPQGTAVVGPSIATVDNENLAGSKGDEGAAIAVSWTGSVGSTVDAIVQSLITWEPVSRTIGSAGAGGIGVVVSSWWQGQQRMRGYGSMKSVSRQLLIWKIKADVLKSFMPTVSLYLVQRI